MGSAGLLKGIAAAALICSSVGGGRGAGCTGRCAWAERLTSRATMTRAVCCIRIELAPCNLIEAKRPISFEYTINSGDRYSRKQSVCLLYTSDAADDLLCVD